MLLAHGAARFGVRLGNWSLGLLALAACNGTEPFVPVPTTVVVTPASLSFSAVGAQQQLTAAVLDQHGDVMKQATVSWSTGSATVASVSATGLVITVGNGTTQIIATAASAHGSVQVTVAQTTRGFFKAAGDFQTGAVGAALPQPIAARITDSLGNGIAGVPVTFAVTQGGGAVSSGTAVTTGTGTAAVSWTLGTVAGAPQSLTASMTDGTLPALAFTASAIAGPAASVELQAGNGQTAPQGTSLPVAPAVLVHDGYGNVKRGAQVTFAVTGGGGVVTGAHPNTDANGVAAVGGWSMGPAGPQALNATVSGTGVAGNPVGFTATSTAPGAPASVVAFVGDQETGLAGFALNIPPGVVVRDAAGNPVGGVGVSFAVSSGGGSVTGENAVTALNGVAQVGSWSVLLGNNSLTATAAPAGLAGNPVTLTSTGVTAQYHIDVRYLKPTSPSRMQAFTDAAAKWEQLIYRDVPDITIDPAAFPAGSCVRGSPALNETIDDLVIFAVLDSIDGPGKILGQGGPCFIRLPGYLPLIGVMRFDTADVANLENAGQFDEVILHEMGHVLGFGTIWEALGLLANPASAGGTDPHFVGPQAVAAFDRVSAPEYTAGAKVPVEKTGGGGTIDSHWRESVFGTEIMTGFLNGGVANPLSVVTVASMGDMAYTVNYAGADPFSLAFALRASRGGAALSLGDDILKLPIHVVDRSGRIVRVVRP